MTDHDPGDEDRREVIADACPFCSSKLHRARVWQTPVFPPMLMTFSEYAAEPTLMDRWMGEVLTTCLDCRPLARRFAELQRLEPEKKQARVYMRDLERRMTC